MDTQQLRQLKPKLRKFLSNYPKTLSSPGFYGGYTPFSDSYLALVFVRLLREGHCLGVDAGRQWHVGLGRG